MLQRISAAALTAVLFFATSPAAFAQNVTAALIGRVLASNGGLPVQDAHIELERNGAKIAVTTTDSEGVYRFTDEPQGEYSVLIVARGYVATRIPSIFITANGTTQLATAVQASGNETQNLKKIGRVVVAASSTASLQTTTTINQYVNPAQIQTQAYSQVGDLLARLPSIDMHTSRQFDFLDARQ